MIKEEKSKRGDNDMSMEWFNRVTGELQDHLNSICEKYEKIGHMHRTKDENIHELNFSLKQKRTKEITFVPSSLTHTMKNFTQKALTCLSNNRQELF